MKMNKFAIAAIVLVPLVAGSILTLGVIVIAVAGLSNSRGSAPKNGQSAQVTRQKNSGSVQATRGREESPKPNKSYANKAALTDGASSTMASQQTDAQWRQFLKGKKFVQLSTYSSGYGSSSGMRSKEELHFCSNGQFAFDAGGSVQIYGGDLNVSSAEQGSTSGRWQVIESSPYAVMVRLTSGGETHDAYLVMDEEKHVYDAEGERMYYDASDVCQ
jgi:hypothetical protein